MNDRRKYWARRVRWFLDSISGFVGMTGATLIVKNLFEVTMTNPDHVAMGRVLLAVAALLYWVTSWVVATMGGDSED